MKKSLIRAGAFAWTALISIGSSAFASDHGGHAGGSAPAAGSSSTTTSAGRAYTATAPHFNGTSVQRYSSMPYHSFPRAGITGYPITSKPAQPRLTARSDASDKLGNWSHNNRIGKSRLDLQTTARLRNWQGKRDNAVQATEEHREHQHHHHDDDWWRHHCLAIVFFDWGFWGWEDGWWFPAWGYDPDHSYYAYDGPIYGYDGLPPDQIVADVQGALQRLGYYPYAVDGVLGPATQEAIENYQRDHGFAVTGGIDPETLASLGFIR
jgi:hypothetical protein